MVAYAGGPLAQDRSTDLVTIQRRRNQCPGVGIPSGATTCRGRPGCQSWPCSSPVPTACAVDRRGSAVGTSVGGPAGVGGGAVAADELSRGPVQGELHGAGCCQGAASVGRYKPSQVSPAAVRGRGGNPSSLGDVAGAVTDPGGPRVGRQEETDLTPPAVQQYRAGTDARKVVEHVRRAQAQARGNDQHVPQTSGS